MNLTYTFDLDQLVLTITIESNIATKWLLREGFGEDTSKDFIIDLRTPTKIKYRTATIPEYLDDRLYSHIMIRDSYISFTGKIGLFMPDVDSNTMINVEIINNTGLELLLSGVGKVTPKVESTTNNPRSYQILISNLYSQLFIFTTKYIMSDKIIIGYDHHSHMFINLDQTVIIIKNFIAKCNKLFKFKDQDKIFVIGYVGIVTDGTDRGHGGNSNYFGYNFLIVDKIDISTDVQNSIHITLLHELYHHYNYTTSSNYDTMWFSEGFTEFFCRYLSMNKKLFASECNKFYLEYRSNPYCDQPNSIMSKNNFWKNRFIEKLPYTKGFCYAYYLYSAYGKNFIKNYIKLIQDVENLKIQTDNDTLKQYIQDKNFNKYIILGKIINFHTDKNIQTRKPLIDFDLIYSLSKSKIINLKNKSYAYDQGLRAGPITKITINYHDKKIIVKQNNKKFELDILVGSKIRIAQF